MTDETPISANNDSEVRPDGLEPGHDTHLPGSLDEYLLYPEKRGPSADPDGPPVKVIWFDRRRPLSSTAMHRWWKSLLARAGVDDCKLHEARHTAITEIVRDTGNLKLAQLLAGHASIQTTADIYAHLDLADLAEALQIVPSAEPSVENRMQNDSDRFRPGNPYG